MYKKYLTITSVLLFFCAIPLGCNWLFLFNCGELMPPEEIVKHQLASPDYCIVGLATRNQGYYYKKALYHHIKPTVLLLGSSRVLQFREDFFTTSALSMGGAMSYLNEGFSLVKEIFSEGKPPEVIIWGLDYWWFNENIRKYAEDITPPPELSHHISLRSYLLPFVWLWQKKISPREYFSRLHPRYGWKKDFAKGIGVDGIFNRNGLAPDGSYVYTKRVIGKEVLFDDKFETTLAHFNNEDSLYSASISQRYFQRFIQMRDYLKSRGSKVIIFIPPLAPAVAEALEKQPNTAHFIADLRRQLTQAGIQFYDFHHPHTLGGNCEFIDGMHGGEVLYAKMLQKMAYSEKDLQPYVNAPYLARVSNQLSNLAMVPRPQVTAQAEIDFLQLGCNKSHQVSWET